MLKLFGVQIYRIRWADQFQNRAHSGSDAVQYSITLYLGKLIAGAREGKWRRNQLPFCGPFFISQSNKH